MPTDPTQAHPPRYAPIAMSEESTVVAEFVRGTEKQPRHYQSEAQLEADFIQQLQAQQYEKIAIHTEAQLIANVRLQLERLNNIRFSDTDWQRFFAHVVARPNADRVEKTRLIQHNPIHSFQLEGESSPRNIRLIDKQQIHNNHLQVIQQYEAAADAAQGTRASRYDVTILVNGLPLVHVELKRRGVALQEAFNQIARYQRESFSAGSGFFEYVQLFVISNGTQSKYYSNSTRAAHIKAQHSSSKKSHSGHFIFTSWWTDAKNTAIIDLVDFARTFFSRHTLLNILTRYCVLDKDDNLLVMRPYQIAASEAILQRITTASHNPHLLGSQAAGGYIWHTTGSGKTLTSFKTAQLACSPTALYAGSSPVAKVIFVVDRKDLDSQTVKAYQDYDRDCVTATVNTRALQEQLEDPGAKMVVTTIQKFSRFVKSRSQHAVYAAHVVIIFDECHRSQFGQMHKDIIAKFRRYQIFGFTGTPIFLKNSRSRKRPDKLTEKRSRNTTTEALFGTRLHLYTIVNAIDDNNVLPFKIDYVKTLGTADAIEKEQVHGIDTESALLAPQRIANIVNYILTHFDQKTRRNRSYLTTDSRRIYGFNSLFATASIEAARKYYTEFARQQEKLPAQQRLKIAIIYSYAPNEDEENFSTAALDGSARDFLEAAIRDYNQLFNTRYDTSGENFFNYYTDLTQRLKNRDVDMVIVVDMFLTGFDAKTLNTLWLDKNLQMHGLIQAYSRTNRIVNAIKKFGNIVSFRNLEQQTNEALTLFGNSENTSAAIIKPYSYYNEKYRKKLNILLEKYALTQFPIASEAQKKEFVQCFGSILRLLNILTTFDEFSGNEGMSDADYQDYLTHYQELYRQWREPGAGEIATIEDDVVFEMELVKQVEVNVDYILLLVEKYLQAQTESEAKEIRQRIGRSSGASPTLHDKKDLIEQFVQTVSPSAEVNAQWNTFVAQKKAEELEQLIAAERLHSAATHTIMEHAWHVGEIKTTGTAFDAILPPMSLFDSNTSSIRQRIVDKLHAFFARFFPISSISQETINEK